MSGLSARLTHCLWALLLTACLPPSGYETARVSPAGVTSRTIAAEGAWTKGKRHTYSGQLGDVSGQHQPFLPVEGALMGRMSRSLPGRLELDMTGWNPLILPPLGLGLAAGVKWQALDTRRLAAAIGARAGGYLHTFGQDGHSRTHMLGMADARAIVSWDVHDQAALYLITRTTLDSVRDQLRTETERFTATGSRPTYGAHVGLATGRSKGPLYLIEVGTSFAPRSVDGPGFARFTVGVGQRTDILK